MPGQPQLPTRVEAESRMPKALKDQLGNLENWAEGNLRDARRDMIWFWSLKIPAVLASACAGLFAYLKWDLPALIIGAIGSLCVLVDGIYPRGMLRNVHLRAVHDLRNLQQEIMYQWIIKGFQWGLDDTEMEKPAVKREMEKVAVKIIQDAQKEVRRIAAYIEGAETSLDTQRK